MALYAFDGTGKSDVPDMTQDSNIVLFKNAYTGQKNYFPGVGTGHGPANVLGLTTGFGGHDRIRDAFRALTSNLTAGDRDIDIIGFSRGAAEAVDFANEIAKQPATSQLPIRFLGVFDVVGSFDLPGTPIQNIGFDFRTPATARRIVHCMALDERRIFFPLTRMAGTRPDETGRLLELWFRGVHSDIGGGDKVSGLWSITLNFMFRQAIQAGLPIDLAKVQQNVLLMDAAKPISFDLVHSLAPLEPPRSLRVGDLVHMSVSARDPVMLDKLEYHYNNPPSTLARIDDNGNVIPLQVGATT